MTLQDIDAINTDTRLAITSLLKLTKPYRGGGTAVLFSPSKAESALTTVFVKSLYLLNGFKLLSEKFGTLSISSNNVDSIKTAIAETQITLMRLQAILIASSQELTAISSYEKRAYRHLIIGNAIKLLENYAIQCNKILDPIIATILLRRSEESSKELLAAAKPLPSVKKTRKKTPKTRNKFTTNCCDVSALTSADATEHNGSNNGLPIKSTVLYSDLEKTNRELHTKSDLQQCIVKYQELKIQATEQSENIAIVMCLSGISDAYLLQFHCLSSDKKFELGQEKLVGAVQALEEAITMVNASYAANETQAKELAYGLSIALDALISDLSHLTEQAQKKVAAYNIIKAKGLNEGWWKKENRYINPESNKARVAKFLLCSCLPKLQQLRKTTENLRERAQLLPITQLVSSPYNFMPHERPSVLLYAYYVPNVKLEVVHKLRCCLELSLRSYKPHYYFCGGVVADYFLTLSNMPNNINLLITTEDPGFKIEEISAKIESTPGFSGPLKLYSFGVRDIILFKLDGCLFKVILQRGALDYASYCHQVAWAPQCLLGTIPANATEKATAVLPRAFVKGLMKKTLQLITKNLSPASDSALIQRYFTDNSSLFPRMQQLLFQLDLKVDKPIADYLAQR